MGEEQGLKACESRLHSKVEPPSVEVNVKLAAVLEVELGGPAVIVVSGGAESPETTVHVSESGLASVLWDPSVARTSKVCEPIARLL